MGGVRASAYLGVLVGGIVVEDDVERLFGRTVGLDGVEKADEFLMPVVLHAAPDDLAFKDVESGEQGCRAVALIIVGHGGGSGPFSSADPAGCGRELGFGFSHRW